MARWQQYAIFAVWLILLASTPLWASNYIVRLAITIAMFTALTLSWNFIGGFAGYPSFSTAAFFGLGCYVGALSQRAGVPMVLAWAIATPSSFGFAATTSPSVRSASSRWCGWSCRHGAASPAAVTASICRC
jgi:branched-chain amino acid transport system permease protein